MLPSGENISDLILGLESDTEENTLTYGINNNPSAVSSGSNGVLGIDVLGTLRLSVDTDVETTASSVIGGKIDDLAAVRQSIYLMLNVEADQYIIYPYTYGMKTIDLIGKDMYHVMAVIEDRIKETLLSDDRITDVSNFEFQTMRNKLTVKFVVNTVYGNIDGETVVSY
jgi:hypothetical protein